jgi:hypothetical protein
MNMDSTGDDRPHTREIAHTCSRSLQTIACSKGVFYTNRSLGFKEEKSRQAHAPVAVRERSRLISLNVSSTVAAVSPRSSP